MPTRWGYRRIPSFEGRLEVDDSAFQADGDGMRPIVRGQFGKDVLDVAFDGFFGDRELTGDHFVGVPTRNEPEHIHFPYGTRHRRQHARPIPSPPAGTIRFWPA